MKYEWEVKTEPVVEPVTYEAVKAHLRLDNNNHKAVLESRIRTIRQQMETDTGRAFVTQTRTLRLSRFPIGETRIYLPGTPAASITHVKYIDFAGVQQTWTSDDYSLRQGEPAFLQLEFDKDWPEHRSRQDEVEIEYVCGESASSVREEVRDAIKFMVEATFAETTEKEFERVMATYNSLVDRIKIGEEFVNYGC